MKFTEVFQTFFIAKKYRKSLTDYCTYVSNDYDSKCSRNPRCFHVFLTTFLGVLFYVSWREFCVSLLHPRKAFFIMSLFWWWGRGADFMYGQVIIPLTCLKFPLWLHLLSSVFSWSVETRNIFEHMTLGQKVCQFFEPKKSDRKWRKHAVVFFIIECLNLIMWISEWKWWWIWIYSHSTFILIQKI